MALILTFGGLRKFRGAMPITGRDDTLLEPSTVSGEHSGHRGREWRALHLPPDRGHIAAPSVLRRRGNHPCSHRIQPDIATQLPEGALVLDHDGLIPAWKQVLTRACRRLHCCV